MSLQEELKGPPPAKLVVDHVSKWFQQKRQTIHALDDVSFAWRSLMAAEIYVTILTGFGLGHLLHYGRELNAMNQVIGIMLVIVVIGLLADKILFSPWERFLHRRWGTGRV